MTVAFLCLLNAYFLATLQHINNMFVIALPIFAYKCNYYIFNGEPLKSGHLHNQDTWIWSQRCPDYGGSTVPIDDTYLV